MASPKLTVRRTSSGVASSVTTTGNPARCRRKMAPLARSPPPRTSTRARLKNANALLPQCCYNPIRDKGQPVNPDAGGVVDGGGNGRGYGDQRHFGHAARAPRPNRVGVFQNNGL